MTAVAKKCNAASAVVLYHIIVYIVHALFPHFPVPHYQRHSTSYIFELLKLTVLR